MRCWNVLSTLSPRFILPACGIHDACEHVRRQAAGLDVPRYGATRVTPGASQRDTTHNPLQCVGGTLSCDRENKIKGTAQQRIVLYRAATRCDHHERCHNNPADNKRCQGCVRLQRVLVDGQPHVLRCCCCGRLTFTRLLLSFHARAPT